MHQRTAARFPDRCRKDTGEEDARIPIDEAIEIDSVPYAPCERRRVVTAEGIEPAPEFFAGFARKPWDRTPGLLTDAALVGRVRQRDEDALAALYDRHAGMMYAMLLRILKDSGAAEEAMQDLFLEVWRRAEHFDERRGTPLAWLLVMGRSRALSRLRTTRRRCDVEVADEFRPETLASPSDPESEIARLRLSERLGTALRSLPVKQKQALELAYFEGMTQTEIAERTGSPLGTVKSRIRAALQSLRTLVGEWHSPETF